MNLAGARILLICPQFFQYDTSIRNALLRRGASVDLLADRPRHDALSKAVIRFNRRIYQPLADRFFASSIDWEADYDFVLVLIGESLSPSILARFKQAFPKARRVLYMWDSFGTKPALLEHIPHFDRVYSFDRNDARSLQLGFRPLFFLDGCVPQIMPVPSYDLSFIGTVHADRFTVTQKLLTQVDRNRTYAYYYVQSRAVLAWRRLSDSAIRSAPADTFRLSPIPYATVREHLWLSRAVIDVQHPRQSGLTIRTLETLAAGKKLITTNADVANYDFYDPANILIVDRHCPPDIRPFLEVPASPPKAPFFFEYGVDGWLHDILGDK